MNRIKTLVSIAVLLLLGTTLSAQNGYKVKGVVIDELGPVIGATVMEQGTTTGTTTGNNGNNGNNGSGNNNGNSTGGKTLSTGGIRLGK